MSRQNGAVSRVASRHDRHDGLLGGKQLLGVHDAIDDFVVAAIATDGYDKRARKFTRDIIGDIDSVTSFLCGIKRCFFLNNLKITVDSLG